MPATSFYSNRRVKKGIHYLTLLLTFLTIGFNASAQYFKPVWVNDIGGTGDSKATNIAVASNDEIYVSGYIRGTVTFDLKQGGAKKLTSNGDADIYIAKYDIVTGNYIWAISMGGSGIDLTNSMTVDNAGNVLITGQFQSSVNFNPQGNFTLTSNGADDIFIAKYTSNGNFVWATSMGGGDIDRGHYITTDNQNNVIITASYTGPIDVDPSAGLHNLPNQSTLACFFAKYDANGNFLWAHPLGNVNQQNLTAVTVDKTTDDIVVAGDFSGNVDFSYAGNPAATFNSPGISNFVARYANDGTYKWVRYLPGSGSGIVSSLHIDNLSNIVITGSFGGQFYPNGPSGTSITANGASDVLVASYKSDGTLNWANHYGSGNSNVSVRYVTTDANNNIFITGYFTGTVNIDPSLSNGILTNSSGGNSALIAGFTSSGTALAAGSFGSSCSLNLGYEIAAVGGNVYVAGSFCQTEDFDTGSCATDNVTAINGTSDSFLASFTIANSSAGIINGFTIPQQIVPTLIDQANHTIAVVVAAGTDVSALTPAITAGSGDIVSPASGVTQNFTSPVTYTVNPGGCSPLAYMVAVTLAKSSSICSGASNTINGDAATPTPDSYTWQLFQSNVWVNAPGVINNKNYQTSALVNNTASNITFILRRQISTSGNLSYDSYYEVTVQPVIVISNNLITSPATSSFCSSGDPSPITGSTPTGGDGTYTYQWQSSADNVNFTDITGATAKDYDPPALNTTTYYRREVTSGVCTTPITSNVVTITVLPAVANNSITAPAVTSFCTSGGPLSIAGSTPTGGNGTYAYQWQSSTDNTNFADIAGANSKDYNSPVLNVTTYFRRTVTSGACSTPLVSNVITITITPSPAVPVPSQAVVSICAGSTATLSVASPQPGITYNWYDSASKTNLLFTGSSYTTGVLNGGETVYVEAENGSCSSPSLASVQVNVNALPAAPAFVTNTISVCDGSVATFSIKNPQPGYTYNWYADATGGTPLFTGTDFTTPALDLNTTFYADAVNSSGCVSVSRAPVNLIVNPIPDITLQPDSVCPGSTATLTASSTDNNAAISWYSNPSGGGALATGTSFTTPVLNSSVTYYAEAADKVTGCTQPARTPVTAQILTALPAPVVTAGATTIASVTFNWDAVPGASGYEVSTDNGQTFVAPSSGSDGLSETITGLREEESVTIIVRATGKLPCQLSTSSTAVTSKAVNPAGQLIYVPNAFTPNGDGRNDVVYVHSENIKSLKFYVYDQWGELIFTSISIQNGWDGTFKGKNEPVGVYVYYLTAQLYDGEQVTKKGTITLIR